LRLRPLLRHWRAALALRRHALALADPATACNDVGDITMSVIADGANPPGILTPIDVPGNGMQFFGIFIMLLAALVFPPAWFMMHGDEGPNAVAALLPFAFMTWTIMFLAGAVFFGCGKIVTQIWRATTS
jgi:hypothetical protein